MTTKKTFGKKQVLRLGFEQALADAIARVCKNLHAPVWHSGGFRMTSVHALCRALGLSEERDYKQVAAIVAVFGDDYGFNTVNHRAECDEDLAGIPIRKQSQWETPLIYLDKVEEVVVMALPRKGKTKLAQFRSAMAA